MAGDKAADRSGNSVPVASPVTGSKERPGLTEEEQFTAAILFELIACAKRGESLATALEGIGECWPQFRPLAQALVLHQTIARGTGVVGKRKPGRKPQAR
jgi:hypothetical protein